jgi:hypothetical protein
MTGIVWASFTIITEGSPLVGWEPEFWHTCCKNTQTTADSPQMPPPHPPSSPFFIALNNRQTNMMARVDTGPG